MLVVLSPDLGNVYRSLEKDNSSKQLGCLGGDTTVYRFGQVAHEIFRRNSSAESLEISDSSFAIVRSVHKAQQNRMLQETSGSLTIVRPEHAFSHEGIRSAPQTFLHPYM